MTIQILRKQGYSKKRIARELGLSIKTVRKYLAQEGKPAYKKRPLKPMKLDPFCVYIKDRLTQAHPDWIPATVMLNRSFLIVELRSVTQGQGKDLLALHELDKEPCLLMSD